MHRFLLLLLLAIVGVSALDMRPLAGPEAPLYATLIEAQRKELLDLALASYRAHGQRDPRWDAEVEALLGAAAASLAWTEAPIPTKEALARAKALTEPPLSCPEPLVAWAAWAISKDEAWKVRNSWCDRANRGWEASRTRTGTEVATEYPALFQALTKAHMLGTYGVPTTEARKAICRQAIPIAANALRDSLRRQECQGAPDMVLRAIEYVDPKTPEFTAALLEVIEDPALPALWPAWVLDGLRARLLVKSAWAWRGSGWASTVTDEGWQHFRADLQRADEATQRSWAAHPSAWVASTGITIAGGGGSTLDKDEWFRRSVSACFDRMSTYDARTNFLRPRWGGSFDRLLEHGQDCFNTGRFDTRVQWELVVALRQALTDANGSADLERLKACLHARQYLALLDRCCVAYEQRDPTTVSRHAAVRAAITLRLGRLADARTWAAQAKPEDLTPALAKDWGVDWTLLDTAPPAIEAQDPSRF